MNLVINCGSSSLKFAVFAGNAPVLRGSVEGLSDRPELRWKTAAGETLREALAAGCSHEAAVEEVLGRLSGADGVESIDAVGHRVVHGGSEFTSPVRIDDAVMERLAAFSCLAPLHQEQNLAGIRAVARRRPGLPQIACFDTAFHASQPALQTTFAVPQAWRERGIRRYGFHGVSYEFIASQLPGELDERADGRVVVLHLGNGASVCGMRERRSVRNSMGMTTVDGLVMGTRCGTLDVGAALYAEQAFGLGAEQIRHVLNHESGLLGLSELSNDVRVLLESEDPRAAFALDLFCERAAQEIAITAVALQGLDAIVFTAGIGENGPQVRARIVERLGWLGLRLDADRNATNARRIEAGDSSAAIRVIPTDEEVVIAQAMRAMRLA